MSYKRTVHCSSCGRSGHNRSSCTQLKKRIERIRAERGDDDYTVRMHDLRTQRRKSRMSKDGQNCSYCQTRGHTRATCPKFKDLKASLDAELNLFKKAWVSIVNHFGLGKGAVISVDISGYNSDFQSEDTVTMMVTELNWDNCNFDMLRSVSGGNDTVDFFRGIILKRGTELSDWQNRKYPVHTTMNCNLLPSAVSDHNHSDDVFGGFGYDLHRIRVHAPGLHTEPTKKWHGSNRKILKSILHKATEWRNKDQELFDADGKKFLEDIVAHAAQGSLEAFFAAGNIS